MKLVELFLVGVLSGCTVEDIELACRPCPCASGFDCQNGQCVKPGTHPSCAAAAGGGGGSGGAGCTPLSQPADFHRAWVTPNTIRWDWTPAGMPTDLAFYEIVTAESQADLDSGSGTARRWTAADNQELKGFYLDSSETGLQDEVSFSITYEHEPNTQYFGKLIAEDRAGCRFESAVVSDITTLSTNRIVLFADTAPPYTLPPELVLSSQDPYAGNACLAFEQPTTCPTRAPTCYENYRGDGLSIPSTGQITQNAFTQKAFIEISVRLDNSTDSDWSQVWLNLGSDNENWKIEPIPARANARYRTYQIPVSELQKSGVKMTLTDFEAAPIEGFAFGCMLAPGGTIRIDEVSIKW